MGGGQGQAIADSYLLPDAAARQPGSRLREQVTPTRQIRAVFDDRTIRLYQAYADSIAEAALSNGTFCPPFRMNRMTWVKPSFLWMMCRCGWGDKPGQNRILAIDITREGFEWALAHSILTHFDRQIHGSHEHWEALKREAPVRVQWDPERTVTLEKLPFRTIQIGLSGSAVAAYVNEWIQRIQEVTGLARAVRASVAGRRLTEATALVPHEREYPLPPSIAARLGMEG